MDDKSALERALETAIEHVRVAEEAAKRISDDGSAWVMIRANRYQLSRILKLMNIPDGQFGPSDREISLTAVEGFVNAVNMLALRVRSAPELTEVYGKMVNLMELLRWFGGEAVDEINAGLARHHWNEEKEND